VRQPVPVAPPVVIAARLATAYGATVEQWRGVIVAEVLDVWYKNPVAFGPGGFLPYSDSSSWTKGKLRDLGRKMAGPPVEEIATAANRVDSKASEDFYRLIDGARPKRGPMPKGMRGIDFLRAQRGSLERIGLQPQLGDRVEQFKRINADKITSLRNTELQKLQGILDEAEAGGWQVDVLRNRILDDLDVTQARAELLARDQTLKLAADIAQERQTQSGIREYLWRTSQDERVRGNPSGKWPRGMHFDLDGSIQSWDAPPVTNENGDRNHPGQDYQCRCIAMPVLPDIEDLPDWSPEE